MADATPTSSAGAPAAAGARPMHGTPEFLPAFVACVLAVKPLHRNFLERALAQITPEEMGELTAYVDHCRSRGLSIEYLAQCYVTIVTDMVREQMHLQKHGHYRHSTFAAVADDVYFDPHYMSRYMYGLALTSYLWPNHRALFRFFKETLPADRSGSYLEIGPGHGYFLKTAIARSAYDRFLGVDVSQTSIELTRDLVGASLPDGRELRLECADFLAADFAHGSFDAIVAGEVLEHVERPAAFLRKMRNVAAPGSFVFLTTCINAGALDHIHLFRNPDEVEELFTSCGFRVTRACICPYEGRTVAECLDEVLAINVAYVLEKVD